MIIKKYKKLKNGKYELLLENEKKLELYEDTILKYELLLKKNIDSNLKEILDFDKECEVYYVALKYLKTRARSKKEIYDNLVSKDYGKESINKAIQKLENQGYIDDLFYAKGFLNNKIMTTSNGPYKIKNELLKKGIDKNIIEDVLKEYDMEIQLEKIRKSVNRILKSNRSRSNKALKMKMITDLTNQGFSKKDIEKVIQEIQFEDDNAIAKKEYEKLYKKLSRKYEKEELEYRIRQKLYQKGFIYK